MAIIESYLVIIITNVIIITQVDIELIMIEVNHSNQGEIDKVLRSAGYKVYKKLKNQDVIYQKIRPV